VSVFVCLFFHKNKNKNKNRDKPLKLTVGGKMLKMGRKFKDFNH